MSDTGSKKYSAGPKASTYPIVQERMLAHLLSHGRFFKALLDKRSEMHSEMDRVGYENYPKEQRDELNKTDLQLNRCFQDFAAPIVQRYLEGSGKAVHFAIRNPGARTVREKEMPYLYNNHLMRDVALDMKYRGIMDTLCEQIFDAKKYSPSQRRLYGTATLVNAILAAEFDITRQELEAQGYEVLPLKSTIDPAAGRNSRNIR